MNMNINECDIVKKSVKIGNHATSVTLEIAFWEKLKKIADEQNCSLRSIIAKIDKENAGRCNLSSAIRVFILKNNS